MVVISIYTVYRAKLIYFNNNTQKNKNNNGCDLNHGV